MTNVADKLRTPAKKWPWFVGVPAVALLAGGTWLGASAFAQSAAAPTPSPTATQYVATLTPAEKDSIQQIADAQHATIIDDAAKAAQAAAAQAAPDAAAPTQHHSSSASSHPYCPAGTSMTQGDANGDPEFCLPDSCFGANPGPECTTPVDAIKP